MVSLFLNKLCFCCVSRLSFTKGHFPKLAECAHFHYENVDFGTIQVQSWSLLSLLIASFHTDGKLLLLKGNSNC